MNYFNVTSDFQNCDKIHNIMAISGGGVKGYAQIQVLKAMEEESIRRFNKRLYEMFALVGGSSVGAINAALLATGKFTMKEIDEFYPNMVRKIFKKSTNLFKWFPKYDRNNFKNAWIDLVGNMKFGDVKTNLLVSSVNRLDDTTYFFKSWDKDSYDLDKPLVDIIMRSFAAPIYFGQIKDPVSKKIWMDGGCGFYNIPIDIVKNEAEVADMYSGKDHTMMYILGGLYEEKKNLNTEYQEESKEGAIRQTLNGFVLPLDGGSARAGSVDMQLNSLRYVARRKSNLHYKYFDAGIKKEYDILDGTSNDAINYYRSTGILMSIIPMDGK